MYRIVKDIVWKICGTAPAFVLTVLLKILMRLWNNYIREFRLPCSTDVVELKEISTDENARERSETIVPEVSLPKFEQVSSEICGKEFFIPQEDEQLFFNYFCKHVEDKHIQLLNENDSQEILGKPSCSKLKDIETFGNNIEEKYVNNDLQTKLKYTRKENEGIEIYKIQPQEKMIETEKEVNYKQNEITMGQNFQPETKVSVNLAESLRDGEKSNDAMVQCIQNGEVNERNSKESSSNTENIFNYGPLSTPQNSTDSNLSKESKLNGSHTRNLQNNYLSSTSSDIDVSHKEMSTDGNRIMISNEEGIALIGHKIQSECDSLLKGKLNVERRETQYAFHDRFKLGTQSIQRHNAFPTVSYFVPAHPSNGGNSNFTETDEDLTSAIHIDFNNMLKNNNVINKVDKSLQKESLRISSTEITSQTISDRKEEIYNQGSNGFCAKSEIYNKDNSEKVEKHTEKNYAFNQQLCNNDFTAVQCVNEATEEQYNEHNEISMTLSNNEKNKFENKIGSAAAAESQTEEDRIQSKLSENPQYILWDANYLELIRKNTNNSIKHGESESLMQIKDEYEQFDSEEHILSEYNRQLMKYYRERKRRHKEDLSDANKMSIMQYDKHRSFNRNNKDIFWSNIIVDSEVNSNIIVSSRQGNDLSVGESECKIGDQPVTSKTKVEENVEKYKSRKNSWKAKQQDLEICHQTATTVIFGSCPMCTERHLMYAPEKILCGANRCNRKIDMYLKKGCKNKIHRSPAIRRQGGQSTRFNLCTKPLKDSKRVSFSENNCYFSFDPDESIFETFHNYKEKVQRYVEELRETHPSNIQGTGSTPVVVNDSLNRIQMADYSLEGDQKKEEKHADKYSSTHAVIQDAENIGITVSNCSTQVQGGEPAEYINPVFEDVPVFDCFPDFKQDFGDVSNGLQNTDDDSLLSKENVLHKVETSKFPKKLKNVEANIKRWAVKNLMPRRRLSLQKMIFAMQK